MIEFDEDLTNETMRKRFKNQFVMVNYAIKLTQNKILEGREGILDSENPVNITIEEIQEQKDLPEEISV